MEKTRNLIFQTTKIKIVKVQSEIESLLLEASFIKKYQPQYNVKLIDGKAYPLIKITIKDKYPKILFVRKIEKDKALYFGPFPNSSSVRLVLRTIRRIFPYQSVLNHPKKICFYHHLDLCPCPTVFDSKETKINYKKNIKHIIQFLNGNLKNVLKELETERSFFSKNEEFEKASDLQKKIDAISLITKPFIKPFEYELNPNLKTDLVEKELSDLKSVLRNAKLKIDSLNRIECFDVSNIMGKTAVGSMVVFTRGEKNTNLYRRFKIRKIFKKPNDFAMLAEIIERRLVHKEWVLPNLMVVDGGKGQVSAGKKVIGESGYSIPIIGLAKREETIITPDLKEVILPKDARALHLIMRIRDEAHRFAIQYHKKRRLKLIFD